jgi:RNA polymerase sigma-70 factor (ECF subfamily)
VASQVFLEALKSIDRFRYTGKPVLAWFYGIAHNMVSRRRRQQPRTTGLEEAEAAMAGGFEEASVTSLVLRNALDQLKPDHREVLVLRFMLELPTRRVAELLGKTEAATYSLQVRAASALRRVLSE